MPPASQSSPLFASVRSIGDVGDLLGSSEKQLKYLLYGRPERYRYTAFEIAKRSGGIRQIKAPMWDIKRIQRRLANFLTGQVAFRVCAHGFVPTKSIASNAEPHVQHRAVLNLDLRDFFPTINFGRVRGLFQAQPFGAKSQVATILAQICCHEGCLPQGAPTSPVISNLICYRMDAQLTRLAKNFGVQYTRYADDLTFSKRKGVFPASLAYENDDRETIVGQPLREIIESNGFLVHPDKTRLQKNWQRQAVTGLTVNSKVNVSRKFVRQIRAIIHHWRTNGLTAAQSRHYERYRHNGRLGNPADLKEILAGKIEFIKMVRGLDDPVRRNLQRQLVSVWPGYLGVMEKENKLMKKRDFFVCHASNDKPTFVAPFVEALIRKGMTVWYDEYDITIGDDLLAKINDGLANSDFGIVVLSPDFFAAHTTWTSREVGAFTARKDVDGKSHTLPLWHNVTKAEVVARNPILGGLHAWKTSEHSVEELSGMFADFLKNQRNQP